jgi:hypothetical protein
MSDESWKEACAIADRAAGRMEAERQATNGDGRPTLRQRLVPIRWGEIHLLPKREPLIEGVFDVGAMSALVGASGAYKTGIAIDWAGHIGTGMAWRGHAVRKGVALYLAVEGGRGIAERFEAWRQHNGVSADDGDVYVIPEPIDLAHGEADAKLLLERIAGIGRVDFIVADTLSRALAGGDENSSKDMGGLVHNCDLIRGEIGAHICVLHHLGKDETRGARGHSLLKAALDTELMATKAGRIGTLELTKQRDGLDGTRWGFAIEATASVVSWSFRPTRQPCPKAADGRAGCRSSAMQLPQQSSPKARTIGPAATARSSRQ